MYQCRCLVHDISSLEKIHESGLPNSIVISVFFLHINTWNTTKPDTYLWYNIPLGIRITSEIGERQGQDLFQTTLWHDTP